MSSENSISRSATACRICGHYHENKIFHPREMFFGSRKCYEYMQCAVCETIQALTPTSPEEMYPKDYYAHKLSGHQSAEDEKHYQYSRLSQIGLGFSVWAATRGYKRLFNLIHRIKPWYCSSIPPYLIHHKKSLRLALSSRVLDVGCGNGDRLEKQFALNGFTRLSGIEPFIQADAHRKGGITIYKMFLSELHGEYDFIMMHHAFEHVPDPRRTLIDLNRLLLEGGECLIRMPVIGEAWKTYGIHWVQLDAPRHRFIFRDKTFIALAAEYGFDCREVVYDSNTFQFWGSEQYLRDIPLLDPRSRQCGNNVGFTAEEMCQFGQMAVDLNASHLGDQACFYLRKENSKRPKQVKPL